MEIKTPNPLKSFTNSLKHLTAKITRFLQLNHVQTMKNTKNFGGKFKMSSIWKKYSIIVCPKK